VNATRAGDGVWDRRRKARIYAAPDMDTEGNRR
jgi:hypothetical protein